jgi:DNA-binding phage protein
MARRSRDWNIGLAHDLRNQEFARAFLLGAIDEGVPLQIALAKVVRAMGVKEFAAKVRMASPNLLRTLNPRHNPTQETLNRLLKPFRLRLSLAPIDQPKGNMKTVAATEAKNRLGAILDDAQREPIVIRRQDRERREPRTLNVTAARARSSGSR